MRVADATVRGGQFADRNFGTAPRLVVKNSTPDYTWDSYLRFDLSGVKGTVSEATVRLVPVPPLVSPSSWRPPSCPITVGAKPPSPGPPRPGVGPRGGPLDDRGGQTGRVRCDPTGAGGAGRGQETVSPSVRPRKKEGQRLRAVWLSKRRRRVAPQLLLTMKP